MRRFALVCCGLWLIAGAGCASQQQPGAAKPWYQFGMFQKQPQPEAQLQVTQIQDLRSQQGAQPGLAGMPSAQAAQPGVGMPAQGGQPGLAGMASASSGQQY